MAAWPGQNSLRVGGFIKLLSRERYHRRRGEGLSNKLAGTAANFLLGSNKSCCKAWVWGGYVRCGFFFLNIRLHYMRARIEIELFIFMWMMPGSF